MLTNTLLSNLSMNLGRMDKLQNQLSTGRKFAHISDDPSSLIYAQSARNKLARLSHYQEAVSVSKSWLTQAEMGVMELQKVVGAVYEELVSAGSVKTAEDKKILAMVVKQLNDHFVDTLNTSYGDRFVFGGYNTPGDFATGNADDGIKPFVIKDGELYMNGFNTSLLDGMTIADFDTLVNAVFPDNPHGFPIPPAAPLTPGDFGPGNLHPDLDYTDDYLPYLAAWDDWNDALAVAPAGLDLQVFQQLFNDVKTLDVGPGISMPVTMNGLDLLFYQIPGDPPLMRNVFNVLQDIYDGINGVAPDDPLGTDELTEMIKTIQDAQNHLLTKAAEIGGRQRRLELLDARYSQDFVNYEQMRSDSEDADLAEVIMYLKMAEAVYQAALSAGARVIQPTLMDFLR
jgi:flagellar hook-associated protein 3 FlgL